MANYVYSVKSVCGREVSVIWDGKQSEIALSGFTHATVDEAYAGDCDGLSIAIYRAHYLAGALKNGFAKRAVEIAKSIYALGHRAAHRQWIEA